MTASGKLKTYMCRQTHDVFAVKQHYLFALVNVLPILVVFSFSLKSLPDNIEVILADAE